MTDDIASRLSGGVKDIVTNNYAYAALKDDGSVITWGYNLYGSNYTANDTESEQQLQSGVVRVVAAGQSFHALKDDGSVVSWGVGRAADQIIYGGGNELDASTLLQSGVNDIYVLSDDTVIAFKNDGSLVMWGTSTAANRPTEFLITPEEDIKKGIKKIESTKQGVALLTSEDKFYAWGATPSLDLMHSTALKTT